MFCEKCGAKIEDGSAFCPECGAPVNQAPAQNPVDQVNPASQAPADQTPVNQTPVNPVPPVDPAVNAGQGVIPDAGVYQNPQMQGMSPIPQAPVEGGKKKGGFPVVLAVILGLLVVLGILVAVFFNNIKAFAMRTFMSPEKYLQYTMNKQMDEATEIYGEAYEKYVDVLKTLSERSDEFSVTMELGDKGQELVELAGLSGVDMSQYGKAGFRLNYDASGDVYALGITGSLNDKDLLGVTGIGDLSDPKNVGGYLQVPQWSAKYIGIQGDTQELLDVDGEQLVNAIHIYEGAEYLPTRAEVEELTDRYGKLVIANITNVERSTEKVTADGIEQKVTVLKYTIDEDMMENISTAVMDTLEEDATVDAILERMADCLNEVDDTIDLDADDMRDGLNDAVQEMMDALVEQCAEDEIEVTQYVDFAGNSIGSYVENGDTVTKTLYTRSKKNFGFEMEITIDKDEFVITGTGTDGKDAEADFVVEYNGKEYFLVHAADFDVNAMKRGQYQGEYNVTLGSAAQKLLNEELGEYAGNFKSIIKALNIDVILSGDETSSQALVKVNTDDDNIVSLTFSHTKNDVTLQVPAASDIMHVDNEEEVKAYIEGMDLEGWADSLESAGLPTEAVDQLRAGITALKTNVQGEYEAEVSIMDLLDEYDKDDIDELREYGFDFFDDLTMKLIMEVDEDTIYLYPDAEDIRDQVTSGFEANLDTAMENLLAEYGLTIEDMLTYYDYESVDDLKADLMEEFNDAMDYSISDLEDVYFYADYTVSGSELVLDYAYGYGLEEAESFSIGADGSLTGDFETDGGYVTIKFDRTSEAGSSTDFMMERLGDLIDELMWYFY